MNLIFDVFAYVRSYHVRIEVNDLINDLLVIEELLHPLPIQLALLEHLHNSRKHIINGWGWLVEGFEFV